MSRKGVMGLSAQIKDKLIQQSLERRLRQAGEAGESRAADFVSSPSGTRDIPEAFYRFDLHPGYQQLRIVNDGAARLGVRSPFFKQHEGMVGATTRIDGKTYINYGSYNYLGMSGDAAVTAAAKAAIDRYGTSVSASRIVSGERPVHREFERALADVYAVDSRPSMTTSTKTKGQQPR